MKRILALWIILLISNGLAIGQNNPKVEIPRFKDKYSKYVKNLEEGKTDIDYQDFRFSFIESEQFIIANKNSIKLDNLGREMYKQIYRNNHEKVIKTAKQMLSMDYTNMSVHKILRETYELIGDRDNAEKYKTIQFGLLNSIVRNGDGKTCKTGWPVIQVSEEYFILNMMQAKIKKQSLVVKDGTCDKIVAKENGKKKTYYFDVSKVFEGYHKLGLQ